MKTTQKTQNSPKKSKSDLGLGPPAHFRVFLGFLIFFNLTKPLSLYQTIAALSGNPSQYDINFKINLK